MTRPRVYVGMSGGVDSSVAAALLLDQDYDVTGVYMKNWSQDLPGMQCPWAEDLADAKRVAVQLEGENDDSANESSHFHNRGKNFRFRYFQDENPAGITDGSRNKQGGRAVFIPR